MERSGEAVAPYTRRLQVDGLWDEASGGEVQWLIFTVNLTGLRDASGHTHFWVCPDVRLFPETVRP
jgi:hypothetical protein